MALHSKIIVMKLSRFRVLNSKQLHRISILIIMSSHIYSKWTTVYKTYFSLTVTHRMLLIGPFDSVIDDLLIAFDNSNWTRSKKNRDSLTYEYRGYVFMYKWFKNTGERLHERVHQKWCDCWIAVVQNAWVVIMNIQSSTQPRVVY